MSHGLSDCWRNEEVNPKLTIECSSVVVGRQYKLARLFYFDIFLTESLLLCPIGTERERAKRLTADDKWV